ncbi:MAG: TonB family protein [Deltaproteobacteria bacterium]|nr:TonB family protein [Deltaproteobacteria bacterium]
MRRRNGSIWAIALGASALVHLVLWRGVPWREEVIPPPPAIQTTLIDFIPERPRPPTPTPPAPTPAAPAVPNRPAARAPARASAPRAAARSEPVVEAAAPTPASAPPAGPGPAIETAHGSGSATPAVAAIGPAPSGAPIGAAPTPAPGGDDGLGALQSLLASRTRGCYPPAAARLGLHGTAKVRFCVASGVATQVSVESGSGESLLDRAAAECVVRPGAPLPGGDRCAVLPVEFKLR